MANSSLSDKIEGIKKEVDGAKTEYNMVIEDSHRLGMIIKDICPEEELKRIKSIAYSAINELKDKDEEYYLRASTLYNSISSILNH